MRSQSMGPRRESLGHSHALTQCVGALIHIMFNTNETLVISTSASSKKGWRKLSTQTLVNANVIVMHMPVQLSSDRQHCLNNLYRTDKRVRHASNIFNKLLIMYI
jgi:hypothetical protein